MKRVRQPFLIKVLAELPDSAIFRHSAHVLFEPDGNQVAYHLRRGKDILVPAIERRAVLFCGRQPASVDTDTRQFRTQDACTNIRSVEKSPTLAE